MLDDPNISADELRIRSSVSSIDDPSSDGYLLYCSSITTGDISGTDGYCHSVRLNADGTFDDSYYQSYPIGYSTSTPAICNGRVYVGTGSFTGSGSLFCLDVDDLSYLWEYDAGGGVQASPAVYMSQVAVLIYYTTNVYAGSVHCVADIGTPLHKWSYTPEPAKQQYVLQGVAISDGKVFFGNDRGYLFAVWYET